MVKQNVMFAQFSKHIHTAGRKAQLSRYKRFIFQGWTLDFIKIKQTREVHRTFRVEDLPILQFKGLLQSPGNLLACAGINLKAYRVSSAPAMQFCSHGFRSEERR